MKNTAQIFKSDKFKTAIISLAIRTKPDFYDASKNALLAKVFSVSSNDYKTKQDFTEKLEDMNGAVYDVSVIKKGDEHIILFFMEVLCIKESSLKEPLEFIKSVLYNPFVCKNAFDKNMFEREKRRLLNEIKTKRDKLSEYVVDRCIEEMYDKKGFGINSKGDYDVVSNITSEELFEYYKYIMENGIFEFIISGNINVEDVKDYIRYNFTDILYRDYKNKCEYEEFYNDEKEVFENADIKQGKLCVGFKTGICLGDDEYIPLIIFNEILGGSPNSLLFLNAREKEGLCYYINSYVYKFKGVIIVQAGIDKNEYSKTLNIIKETIKNIKNEISDDVFENAKSNIIKMYKDIEDSMPSVCDNILNNILIEKNIKIEDYINSIEKCKKDEVLSIAEKVKLDTIYFISSDKEEVVK